MKVSIIALLGLLGSFQLFSQGNNPYVEEVYKSLTEKPIEFTSFDSLVSFHKEQEYDVSKIMTQPEIIFFRAANLCPDPPYSYDKLKIGTAEYTMEQLFYEPENLFVVDGEEPTRFIHLIAYTFDFNRHQYACLYFMNAKIPTSTPNLYIVLLNLSKPENRPILLGIQASFNPYCFGDFNNDGILDYAHWTYGNFYKPTMHFYSVVKDSLIQNTEYFLTVDRKYDGVEKYKINKTKSRWFEKMEIDILYSLRDSIMKTRIDSISYHCEDDASAIARREYRVDTLFFENGKNFKLCLWKDTVLLNNEVVCHFKDKNPSFSSFEQIAYADYKQKKYLYLYPRYSEINEPRKRYGSGVLITFDKGKFTIRENYDYFDKTDFDDVFKFNKSFLSK